VRLPSMARVAIGMQGHSIRSARRYDQEFGRVPVETDLPVCPVLIGFLSRHGSGSHPNQIDFHHLDPRIPFRQQGNMFCEIRLQAQLSLVLRDKPAGEFLCGGHVCDRADPERDPGDRERQGSESPRHQDSQQKTCTPARYGQNEDRKWVLGAQRRTRSAVRISPWATTIPRASRVVPRRGS